MPLDPPTNTVTGDLFDFDHDGVGYELCRVTRIPDPAQPYLSDVALYVMKGGATGMYMRALPVEGIDRAPVPMGNDPTDGCLPPAILKKIHEVLRAGRTDLEADTIAAQLCWEVGLEMRWAP